MGGYAGAAGGGGRVNLSPRIPRTAWMRTQGKVAIICAWCPDRGLAESRAKSAGMELSHGICPECSAEHFRDSLCDANMVPAAGHSSGAPVAMAIAVESTPEDGAVRVVSLAALKRVTGLSALELAGALGRRLGEVKVRRAWLPELIGELATSGRWRQAARLLCVVSEPQQRKT